jgi:hypothetical protein
MALRHAPDPGARRVTTTSKVIGLDLFPAASVAVQVTFVVPIGSRDPEGGVHVAVTAPSRVSPAMTV